MSDDAATLVGVIVGGVTAIVVVGLCWLLAHNRFVQLQQHVTESRRDVDVELRRRHDLVPQLVEVVRAAAGHERELLALLTAERGWLSEPVTVAAEAHPALRTSSNFLALQRQLVRTENRLAAARRIHSSNVERYNERVQSVPTNLVAWAGGFRVADHATV